MSYKQILVLVTALTLVLHFIGFRAMAQLNPVKPTKESITANTDDKTTPLKKSDDAIGKVTGVSTLDELKEKLRKFHIRMIVMNRAAATLEKSNDGSSEKAVMLNLVKLKIVQYLSEALPPVARTVEDYRWDLRMEIDRKKSTAIRLRAMADQTQRQIDATTLAILEAEDEGKSEVTINSLKKVLEHRLAQLDTQLADADKCESLVHEHLTEISRLKTLDEILDGIASERAVYAERLRGGINRETSVAASKALSDGIESVNEMISILTLGEDEIGDGEPAPPSVDPNEKRPGSVKEELNVLGNATKLKKTSRVEEVLRKAREARDNN
ncbi:hypothetical protein Mal35_16920 [Gimesia maris]|uniref:hypothetical protein n=1 Tax=Gimesia maris TaxID=122 RepID=UPI0011892D05|nr:hypothetical protein [Gimesia maris]QDT78260.1 hypothetical protein Mal35_16920 [Gimesia maris]